MGGDDERGRVGLMYSKKEAMPEIVACPIFNWRQLTWLSLYMGGTWLDPDLVFSRKLNLGFSQYFRMWSYGYKVIVFV